MRACRDCPFFKADLNATLLPDMVGCGMLGECRLTGKCVASGFKCSVVSDGAFSQEAYAEIFPGEIKDAVKAMSSEARWAVLGALVCGGDLSLSDLKEMLRWSKENLQSHLKALERAGLVECVLIGDIMHYRITLLGWRLILAFQEMLAVEGGDV